MFQNPSLFQMLFASFIISLTLSLLFFKIRSALLRRHVLETQLITMKPGYKYTFVYRHSLLNGRKVELNVDEGEKKYILTETTYYNFKVDATISVFVGGVMVYNAELRNVIYSDFEPIGEEEFDGNL